MHSVKNDFTRIQLHRGESNNNHIRHWSDVTTWRYIHARTVVSDTNDAVILHAQNCVVGRSRLLMIPETIINISYNGIKRRDGVISTTTTVQPHARRVNCGPHDGRVRTMTKNRGG